MPRKIAQTTLNASTIDILNVIRKNASPEYVNLVPEIKNAKEVPVVGEVIYGTPVLANEFLNALVNRIATVRLQSATFNNPYSALKKGYLEFGETVESIFVNIAKAVEFTPEKGEEREFKRTIPDVRSAFHSMNWRVMYPITVQDEDLKQAFYSIDGVTELIEKIIDQVYTGAEYDEFLLFKYLLIKSVSHGEMKPISVGDGTDLKQDAKAFRGTSNMLPFMSDKYNESGVKTNTPKDRQIIFMDAMYNADFDVSVLASAFNMNKADFMGRLYLIDDFTTFDNERFNVIRENSDFIEEVTDDELALMKDVRAILLDEDWFQIYDNNNKMTTKEVASGLYWNYFYHTWKTISHSPFANAVVFVKEPAKITVPETLTVTVKSKDVSDIATVLTLDASATNATLEPHSVIYVQDETSTTNSIAVQEYGALIIPATANGKEVTLKATVNGVTYTGATTVTNDTEVGATVTMNKAE